MPNNYFQFKEFTIYQEKSTLKVNTDSCVFGAWSAKKALQLEFHIARCLDIGAGTGLLMLMLAQQVVACVAMRLLPRTSTLVEAVSASARSSSSGG